MHLQIRIIALVTFCAYVLMLPGCSLGGYYIGTEIDGDPKVLYNDESLSLTDAFAQCTTEQPLRIYLRNGQSINALFQSVNSSGDSILVIRGNEIQSISSKEIQKIEEKSFSSATKLGILIGAGVDIAVFILVISELTVKKSTPVIE